MPVKTGIQPRAYAIRPYKNSWIPARPRAFAGLAEMMPKLFNGIFDSGYYCITHDVSAGRCLRVWRFALCP